MLALVPVVAIILTLMLALRPIELVTTDDAVLCGMRDRLQFMVPLGILLFGLLCSVCYQAWLAKDLVSEFSESKSIFGMLMFMDLIIFLCWPMLLFNLGNPDVAVMITSAANFLMVTSLKLFLFIPKILHSLKQNAMEEHKVQ